MELLSYIEKNAGKILGGLIGFVFGYLTIKYGFFQAIFVVIATILGVVLGNGVEKAGSFKGFLGRIWGE